MYRKMPKPILNTVLSEGGALDGMRLTVEQNQKILFFTEVKDGKEIFHQYMLSKANTFQYMGIAWDTKVFTFITSLHE